MPKTPSNSAEQTATPHSTPPEPAHSLFARLDLSEPLLKALHDLGFSQPTDVQNAVIPAVLQAQAQDLMVSSQTGSGKTAAFLLPILHKLEAWRREQDRQESLDWERKVKEAQDAGLPPPKKPRRKNPMDPRNFKAAAPFALVLCPTRELAIQVANDAIDLVKYTSGIRIASVVGGLPYAAQIARLQNATLVVATPGRLLDLQGSKQIDLQQVQYLVLDEADRMLDLGFAEDLAAIHESTAKRQLTLMFSATLDKRVQGLAAGMMRNPRRVEVDSHETRHANIEQRLYWADNKQHQRQLLDHFLRDTAIQQAIVFASTQIECDELAQDLQQEGFSAVSLHGALSQGLRNRRLAMLREGRIQILVATDVAARGIDVSSISHVFNHGVPMKAEDYTHRVGRTGRAGRDGIAITIASWRDARRISAIEAFNKQAFQVATVAGLEPQARPKGKPAGKSSSRRGFEAAPARSDRSRPPARKSAAPRSKSPAENNPSDWSEAPRRRSPSRDEQPAFKTASKSTASSRNGSRLDVVVSRLSADAQRQPSEPFGSKAEKSRAAKSGKPAFQQDAPKKKSASPVNWVGAKSKAPDRRKRKS